MGFIKALLDFLTEIMIKFIPGRKEKALDRYLRKRKELELRRRRRETKRNALLDESNPTDNPAM